MSIADKIKWNEKFSKKSVLLQPREPSIYVQKYFKLPQGKQALDLACGAGRHALFLARNGFNVDALDISEIALNSLQLLATKECLTSLHVKECDLDTQTFIDTKYDFIIMSNYLDRELIKRASDALHVKGIFIIETYMLDETNEKKESKRDNLLQVKELIGMFDNSFEVLEYDEFDNESYEIYRMKKQLIVVQKKY